MPPKNREYYLGTSPGQDFAWLTFRAPTLAQHPENKAEPTPTYTVPKHQRTTMPPITEEPAQALMLPANIKAKAGAVATKSEAAKSKKAKPPKAAPRRAGPWSDWYVSEDRHYFWRARKTPSETWDYQYKPSYQEQPRPAAASSTTPRSKAKQQPSSPSPGPAPTSPTRVPNFDSPKTSWPTIITTSTGYPTEVSASSSRTLSTLAREVEEGSGETASLDLVPIVVTARPQPARSKHSKRPVGPVLRLIQESRSRRSKSEVNKSAVAVTAFTAAAGTTALSNDDRAKGKNKQQGQGDGAVHDGHDHSSNGYNTHSNLPTKARAAYAKKLHAKVKSEKELKADPKRRVRTWLKGVELDTAPLPLDEWGFPIYR